MSGAILDHLWQSTLLALAVALLTLAFRKARAAVRHGLWVVASVKFLVPFALLEAVGRLMAPRLHAGIGQAPEVAFIAQAADPFSHPVAVTAAASATVAHPDLALGLATVWALGMAAVLVAWIVRWTKLRDALRSTTPLALPAPMPVRSSSSLMEPGLVGLWRPILLVPDSLFDHLARPQIDAIVAHEACHLRRRDNLIAAVHMLVEALFWFHPMVWWIGARLIEERERACDEAVVSAGHDRLAYARGLVECCRLYLRSPLPCAAGASGAALQMRVDLILNAPPSARLVASSKAMLAAAAAGALVAPISAGWLASPEVRQVAARVIALAEPLAPARLAGTVSSQVKARAVFRLSSSQRRKAQTVWAAPSADAAAPSAPESVANEPLVSVLNPAPAVRSPEPLGVVASRLPDVHALAPKAAMPVYANDLNGEANCYEVFGDLRCNRDAAPLVQPRAPLQPAIAARPAIKISKTTEAAEDPDEVLCAIQDFTGSRFMRRVCMSRAQWRQQQQRFDAARRAWRNDPFSDPPASYYW